MSLESQPPSASLSPPFASTREWIALLASSEPVLSKADWAAHAAALDEWVRHAGSAEASTLAMDLAERALNMGFNSRPGPSAGIARLAERTLSAISGACPGGAPCGSRGALLALRALRPAQEPSQEACNFQATLAIALAMASDPLGREAFALLMDHPHPRPLFALAKAKKTWLPSPAQVGDMAVESAILLANGDASQAIRLARIAKALDCSEAAKAGATRRRAGTLDALLRGCASGCDRFATKLLVDIADPTPEELAQACLASVGLSLKHWDALGQALAIGRGDDSSFLSACDGSSRPSHAQLWGRSLGTLFNHPRWEADPALLARTAQKCAGAAVSAKHRGSFETALAHCILDPSLQARARAWLGETFVALAEAAALSRSAPKAPSASSDRMRL